MAMTYDGCASGEKRSVSSEYITDNRIQIFIRENYGKVYARVQLDHSTRYKNDIGSEKNEFDQTLRLEPYEAEMIGKALIKAAKRTNAEIDRRKNEILAE